MKFQVSPRLAFFSLSLGALLSATVWAADETSRRPDDDSARQLASDCPELGEGSPASCASSPQGWFYASTPDAAEELAVAAREASELFRRHFGRPASRGAVVAGGSAGVRPAWRETLSTAGASWALPWLDADDRRRFIEDGVRKQIAAQLGDADPSLIDAAVAQALAKAKPSGRDADATLRGGLRHEIGHLLLIQAFWPDSSGGGSHYGGPGPDWLDEVAAVLMEDPSLTASRRSRLRNLAGDDARGAALLPLADFFVATHPLAGYSERLRPTDGGSTLTVLRGEEAQALSGRGIAFYVQARAVADFLIESGGEADVFGSIAQALSSGRDMDAWLALRGRDYGLPDSVEGLQRQWRSWLAQRL